MSTIEELKAQRDALDAQIAEAEQAERARLEPLARELAAIVEPNWQWENRCPHTQRACWIRLARHIDQHYVPRREMQSVDGLIQQMRVAWRSCPYENWEDIVNIAIRELTGAVPEPFNVTFDDPLEAMRQLKVSMVDPDPEFDAVASEHFWELTGNEPDMPTDSDVNLAKDYYEVYKLASGRIPDHWDQDAAVVALRHVRRIIEAQDKEPVRTYTDEEIAREYYGYLHEKHGWSVFERNHPDFQEQIIAAIAHIRSMLVQPKLTVDELALVLRKVYCETVIPQTFDGTLGGNPEWWRAEAAAAISALFPAGEKEKPVDTVPEQKPAEPVGLDIEALTDECWDLYYDYRIDNSNAFRTAIRHAVARARVVTLPSVAEMYKPLEDGYGMLTVRNLVVQRLRAQGFTVEEDTP